MVGSELLAAPLVVAVGSALLVVAVVVLSSPTLFEHFVQGQKWPAFGFRRRSPDEEDMDYLRRQLRRGLLCVVAAGVVVLASGVPRSGRE